MHFLIVAETYNAISTSSERYCDVHHRLL